jgi:hypothetical protein
MMKATTGQILRALGLLIELLGVIAVMVESRSAGATRIPVPGGGWIAAGWIAVAVGFSTWLAGRLIIAASDRRNRHSKPKGLLDRD